MTAQLLWLVARRRGQITSLLCGTALGYTVHSNKTILRNDSGNNTQSQHLRATVHTGRRHESGNQDTTSEKSRGTQPISKKPVAASYSVTEESGALPAVEDTTNTPWASFSLSLETAYDSVSSLNWSSIGDSITDFIVPEWVQVLPGYIAKLQREMNVGPGSMGDEIWQEAQDVYMNPEITTIARVRVGKDLCTDEKEFIKRRKRYTTQALAKYLDISEEDVDPEDVPTIAMCGSGGGLRALVAGASSYLSAQEAGLFDCVTYTAGVSGSCWLQTLYYTTLGGQRYDKIMEHLKHRIGIHIAFPPDALKLLTTAPTNKYLLSGILEKLKRDPKADFGLVDVYGILLAARLLVPRGELGVDDRDLKISNQRTYLKHGANPLPIYTAVRHEIPLEEQRSEEEKSQGRASEATKEKAKRAAWFQWFEMTPYELWCEEMDAGIPSWSIGRQFRSGMSVPQENGLYLPELRIPFLMGIWGSAFCATLSHYYKELRPIVKGLAGFGGINNLIEEQNDELIKVHPIDPASIPNYLLGLEGQLPPTCPEGIFRSDHLALMDSGMSNNLPIYPLLRAGRNVDLVIIFDASADIKTENWLSVADGYAQQRGIKGWPLGAGWPNEDTSKDETRAELEASDSVTAQEAAIKIADSRETRRETDNTTEQAVTRGSHEDPTSSDLTYCNVWVGTTLERHSATEPPQSKRIHPDTDWELLSPNAGITVIYFPFLPNSKVEGVDPNTTPFMSTWNFVYTPEEIEKVVRLARTNFEEGKEQTRRTVRAVYERKKMRRLEMEEKGRIKSWRRKLKDHGDHFV